MSPLSGNHPLQAPGVVCQMCQRALPVPRTKTSRPPSAFFPTVTEGELARCWPPGEPSEYHPLQAQSHERSLLYPQEPPDDHRHSSPPSLRENWLELATGEPSEAHPLQGPGVVCQLCKRSLSVPTTKTSRRPSAFFPTVTEGEDWPRCWPPGEPSGAHPLQAPGVVCQL